MKKTIRGLAAVLLAIVLSTFADTAPAQANEPTATPYAFQVSPGCLGLHTGVGIDGYEVDGLFYDVPDINEVQTITFPETGGLQGDYSAVALPGYTASNVPGTQFVQIMPGQGCGDDAEASAPAPQNQLRNRLDRKDARIDRLRERIQRLRDRLR